MRAPDAEVRPAGRRDRGFALIISIFALVIIAALVTGAFFAARQEMKVGLNSRTTLRAFAAAEAGINNAIASWQVGAWNTLAVGDSAPISGTLGSGSQTSSYAGTVRRLNSQLFLVRATGTAASAQRTLAALTRLQIIQMNFQGALTTRGAIKIGGSAYLDGRDRNPSSWGSCPTTGLDTLPGVLLPDPTQITVSGGSLGSYVQGDPPVAADPSISDSTFFKYGDLDWNELVQMATKIYPTGDVGPLNDLAARGTATTCNTSIMSNWGDPYHQTGYAGCWNYFPIIYVNGNLKITGGYGQGILLVSGNLDVAGGAEFYGPVIVRGTLSTSGTGGHFNGGVMAANVNLELTSVLGDALINYSSCAIATALQFNAPGRLLRDRSWAEVF